MEPKPPPDVSAGWELYAEQQKQALLGEFIRKNLHDYYSKKVLLEFLRKKSKKK